MRDTNRHNEYPYFLQEEFKSHEKINVSCYDSEIQNWRFQQNHCPTVFLIAVIIPAQNMSAADNKSQRSNSAGFYCLKK